VSLPTTRWAQSVYSSWKRSTSLRIE
jgi:hypothetical protein